MTKTIYLGFGIVCFAFAAFGAWPTYHGESGLTGYSEASLPDSPALLWRYNAAGEVYQPPVSDGKQIYFSAKKGRVIALDLVGEKVWEHTFSRTNSAGQDMAERFEAPLAVFDGKVLASASRGILYALDGATGSELWQYDVDGVLLGSPNLIVGSTGSLSVITIDQSEGSLHALELSTGKRLWETEGVERCDGSPGVGAGRIVFGSCAAALHQFSTKDGAHVIDVDVGGDAQIAGGAAILDGRAYAGTRDGRLVCADLLTGEILWSFDEAEAQSFATPAVTKEVVIFSSDDGFIYAVSAADVSQASRLQNGSQARDDGAGGTPAIQQSQLEAGEQIWKFDTGGIPTSPVIAGDKVAVSADGTLFLLDLKTGKKVWSKNVSDEISSPAIINGMLVVGADDGTVSAYGKQK